LRGSRPVLGGAEGEIPSAYLPPENCGVFQLLKNRRANVGCPLIKTGPVFGEQATYIIKGFSLT